MFEPRLALFNREGMTTRQMKFGCVRYGLLDRFVKADVSFGPHSHRTVT